MMYPCYCQAVAQQIVVCLRGAQWEVVDGFKRLAAARALNWPTLLTRQLPAEEGIW